MLLSNDLIRDTLKCVNDVCEAYTNSRGKFSQPEHHWKSIYENAELESKYEMDDVKYCLIKLGEGHFIHIDIPDCSGGIPYAHISGLTWEGHELLKNISDDSVWNYVKKKLGDAANFSIKAIASVATEAATACAKSIIGLP